MHHRHFQEFEHNKLMRENTCNFKASSFIVHSLEWWNECSGCLQLCKVELVSYATNIMEMWMAEGHWFEITFRWRANQLNAGFGLFRVWLLLHPYFARFKWNLFRCFVITPRIYWHGYATASTQRSLNSRFWNFTTKYSECHHYHDETSMHFIKSQTQQCNDIHFRTIDVYTNDIPVKCNMQNFRVLIWFPNSDKFF